MFHTMHEFKDTVGLVAEKPSLHCLWAWLLLAAAAPPAPPLLMWMPAALLP